MLVFGDGHCAHVPGFLTAIGVFDKGNGGRLVAVYNHAVCGIPPGSGYGCQRVPNAMQAGNRRSGARWLPLLNTHLFSKFCDEVTQQGDDRAVHGARPAQLWAFKARHSAPTLLGAPGSGARKRTKTPTTFLSRYA
jgi:hypothetical protein